MSQLHTSIDSPFWEMESSNFVIDILWSRFLSKYSFFHWVFTLWWDGEITISGVIQVDVWHRQSLDTVQCFLRFIFYSLFSQIHFIQTHTHTHTPPYVLFWCQHWRYHIHKCDKNSWAAFLRKKKNFDWFFVDL